MEQGIGSLRRNPSESFGQEIIAFIPPLRAFAISLSGSRSLADDLVQETILKAWANRDSFEPGTNMKAWLHTILRNHFFNLSRNYRRLVEDPDGRLAGALSVAPTQVSALEYRDLRRALTQLSPEQREALILTSAGGFSYEEVADIAGCAVGTVKSRINRARERLHDLLEGDLAPEIPMAVATLPGATQANLD